MIKLRPPISFIRYMMLGHIPVLALAILCGMFVQNWLTVSVSFLISYVAVYIYGTNIFWHRYWSHKQFQTYEIVAKFFTVAGLFSLCGGPIGYTLTHRIHHAYSDTDKDPHSPIHGKYHAFIGWLLKAHKYKPSILLVKDLLRHRWLVFVENNKLVIMWLIVLIVGILSTDVLLGLLLASLLTFIIECSINTFLHDVDTKTAKDAPTFLCNITAGGLKHKMHHDSRVKLSLDDPGYYFVKIISKPNAE